MARILNHILTALQLSLLLSLHSCGGNSEYRYAVDCLTTVQEELDSGAGSFSVDRLNYAYNYFLNGGSNEMRAWSHYLNSVVKPKSGLGSDCEWHDDIVEACRYVRRTSDHSLAAKIYLEYGLTMISHRWYDSALPLLNSSLTEAERASDIRTQVLALMNISRSYMLGAIGPDSDGNALRYSMKAVSLADGSGDLNLMASSQYSLSACCQNLGYYPEALDAARKYTELSERLYRTGQRSESVRYIQIARCHHLLAQTDSALFYAGKDLTHEDINVRINANQLLAAIHSELPGDSVAALSYSNRYYMLRDSLDRISQNDVILAAKGKQELQKARHDGARTAVLILLAFFMICAASAYFISIMRRRLAASEETIIAGQSTISDLKKDVDSLTRSVRDKEKQVDTLKIKILDNEDLIQSIKKNPHYLKDREWDMLKEKVERLEPDFLRQAEKCGLTENATRLAVCTKLGFTTAECAAMFSIDPKSITKAKQRLKAKMST